MTLLGPINMHRGMTFGYYARDGYYSSADARLQVDRMAELNIEWVCLVAIVLQDTFASTRMYRDFKQTPADDEIRDISDYIHSKGMKVQLRPMTEAWDGTQRMAINFPGDGLIIPGKPITHWRQWFNSMVERTLHYGAVAQRAGCEAFGLDSELDHTVGQNAHWKETVAAARSVYSGHLTSGHTRCVDFTKELSNKDHWFYDIDSVGCSFYDPVSDQPGASLEAMREKLVPSLAYYREVAELYGKPFYFAECGCCSTAGATKCPWGFDQAGGYDGDEQARFMEAVLDTFWAEPWWMGMYWWKWDEQNDRPWFRDDPRGDKGFTVWGKPAAETMKAWYGRTDR